MGSGACCQDRRLEFEPQDPQDGKREPVLPGCLIDPKSNKIKIKGKSESFVTVYVTQRLKWKESEAWLGFAYGLRPTLQRRRCLLPDPPPNLLKPEHVHTTCEHHSQNPLKPTQNHP